jgi:Methyltransferase FkbM domain
MAQRIVFDALRLLIPRDVPGVGKIRLGGVGDGGYVLLDRLDPAQTVMSFGVGPTVTFDADMAERGHSVLLFDHTVDALPQEHPRFRWFRQGIAGVTDPAADLFTLAEHMDKLAPGAVDPILKIDVEGAEWEAFGEAPAHLLRRFAQITVEFHALEFLEKPDFNATAMRALAALAQDFAPVHVHANNWGGIGYVGGLPLPTTIEVTYARRDLFRTAPSRTFYPTPLDTPNCDARPDFALWFYPFHPGAEMLEFPE